MTIKYYSGIGSREIPETVEVPMTKLAKVLNKEYWLRSGNADGSDQAFAKGVSDEKAQIWLPWEDFNNKFRKDHPKHTYKLVSHSDRDAWESINKFHPYGSKLNHTSRLFMSRNYRQVIGLGEPNSEFVICWTSDGKDSGGTGQAIRIARHFKIPVYNLYDMTVDQILKEIEKLNLLQ